MTAPAPFADAPPGLPDTDPDGQFLLELDGFGGPIDLLLTLARDQKVDLTQISILKLAEQYLAFIEEARALRLELAADYLVMAAWLAYLKSRLLLPEPPAVDDAPSAETLAQQLAFQLRRLDALRGAVEQLQRRPLLGVDTFPRGVEPAAQAPQQLGLGPVIGASLNELLQAYAAARLSAGSGAYYRPPPQALVSLEAAAQHLRQLLNELLTEGTSWAPLTRLAPPAPAPDPVARRSALAATLAAALELTREGEVELAQETPFAPLYVRRLDPDQPPAFALESETPS